MNFYVALSAYALLAIFSFLSLIYFVEFPYISGKVEDWGVFGDYFGGVFGTILSVFAVGGALYTVSLQRRQLTNLIKSEKRRDEEEGVYRVEKLVGQLLDVLDSIVRDSSIGPRAQVSGRRVFDFLYRQIRRRYRDVKGAGVDNPSICCRIAYDDVYSKYGDSLGAYFRTLYLIVKTIDSQSDEDSRSSMISWVKCRLTRFELVVIYYNCAFGEGRGKFKPLIERYSMLEHLDVHLLFNVDWHHHYEKGAFGGKVVDHYFVRDGGDVQYRLFD